METEKKKRNDINTTELELLKNSLKKFLEDWDKLIMNYAKDIMPIIRITNDLVLLQKQEIYGIFTEKDTKEYIERLQEKFWDLFVKNVEIASTTLTKFIEYCERQLENMKQHLGTALRKKEEKKQDKSIERKIMNMYIDDMKEIIEDLVYDYKIKKKIIDELPAIIFNITRANPETLRLYFIALQNHILKYDINKILEIVSLSAKTVDEYYAIITGIEKNE